MHAIRGSKLMLKSFKKATFSQSTNLHIMHFEFVTNYTQGAAVENWI